MKPNVIYLIVSGAGSARYVPELIDGLATLGLPVYTLLTENADRVISPFQLSKHPGHRLVDGYFDPAIDPDRPPGLTVVAPATFNTVNKLGQGIADTLAHSLVAEAIGGDWPVVVVPAVNAPLANHPRFGESLTTLAAWGVTIVPLQGEGPTMTMAAVPDIVAAAKAVIGRQ